MRKQAKDHPALHSGGRNDEAWMSESRRTGCRSASAETGFFVASFGLDGEAIGVGFWSMAKLSCVWLEACAEHLDAHGASFDAAWGGSLNDIQTTFTSVSGSAIATLYVRSRVAISLLLL